MPNDLFDGDVARFERGKKVGVEGQRHLDSLGHAGGNLAGIEGIESVGIDEDGRGLVEGAEDIFNAFEIDRYLAADRGIDLRE